MSNALVFAGDTSIRKRSERRKESLKALRTPYEAQWTELAENIAPSRLRLMVNQKEGQKLRGKIVDSTGTFALRTLASGMHSGITSPARPWFKLMTFDPELREFGPVRAYIDAVEKRMREIFQGSNVYNAFHIGYGDLGLFGQSCGLLIEDERSVIRMLQLQHGSFWLARNERGVADTVCREFSWSVERIVKRFAKGRGEGADLSSISHSVRRCYDRGDYDERFTINHLVQPRHDRSPGKIDKLNKPFASVYWEEGASDMNDREKMLEVSGFDENPIIAPPWELPAEDHYAVSPGIEALPDVKMLQSEQTDKVKAIQKKVDPPMVGPTSLRNNPASLLPGALTYVDVVAGGQSFQPAMQVQLQTNELREDIQDVQGRIERAFYADLFLMISNMEGIQPRNQFEIAERREEKLLALGPVLENIYGAQLAPTISRTYEIMARRGELPPAPQELDNTELKIEYISMLAQAQKAVATGAIERVWAFAGNISAVKPEVLDKLDADQSIDDYADMVGAPASMVVSDDRVSEIRKSRADAQAQAAQAESTAAMMPAVKQGADAAKVLAETDARAPGSLLQRLGLS